MRPCPWTDGAPVGTYRVRVYQPGKSDFAGAFEVQSYQLEPIDLSFDLKKTVFYRGRDHRGRCRRQVPVRRALCQTGRSRSLSPISGS